MGMSISALWWSLAIADTTMPSDLFGACSGIKPGEIRELLSSGPVSVTGLGSVFTSQNHYVAIGDDGRCFLFDRKSKVARRTSARVGTPPSRLEVLAPNDCWAEQCPILLAAPGGYSLLGEICDDGMLVSRINLFDGRKIAQIQCNQSAGAGAIESWHWVHVVAGLPKVLLSVPTGHSEAPSDDERKMPGFRPIEPTGCIVVNKREGMLGAVAVIPEDAPNGPQILYYRWDSENLQFLPDEKAQVSVKCPKRKVQRGGSQ